MKNWKFWEKSLLIRQKAHTEGKSLPKPDNIDSWWSLGKSKKSVEQKGKTQAKRFPYDLRCPKPRDQKIEKFLPQLISSGVCRTSGEKKLKTVSHSKAQKKWLGLVFKFSVLRKTKFAFEICFDKALPSKRKFNPQMKNLSPSKIGFFACLRFSAKRTTFFLKDLPNFSETFCGVILKWVMIILYFLKSLQTKVFWLWRAFAHLSKWLRTMVGRLYI